MQDEIIYYIEFLSPILKSTAHCLSKVQTLGLG
jgi:hypothetical protein